MWIIEKEVKKGKYIYGLCKEHPHSTKNGYVLMHRLIMENTINRLLTTDEVVHHIDENSLNNQIENLIIMNRAEHSRMHRSTGRTFLTFTCKYCGKIFEREIKNTYGKSNNFCSRSCNGKSIKCYVGQIS